MNSSSDHGAGAIGFVYGPSSPELSTVGQRALADARLIAAAPELLEALRELLEAETAKYPCAEQGQAAQTAWVHRKSNAEDAARAAIAKATGNGASAPTSQDDKTASAPTIDLLTHPVIAGYAGSVATSDPSGRVLLRIEYDTWEQAVAAQAWIAGTIRAVPGASDAPREDADLTAAQAAAAVARRDTVYGSAGVPDPDAWRCLKHGECSSGKCIHGVDSSSEGGA